MLSLVSLCFISVIGSSRAEEVNAGPTAKAVPPSDDPTRDSCTVPEHLYNMVFANYPCQGSTSCNMSGNTLVPTGELVTITCVPGYNLVQGLGSVVSEVFSQCQHGTWNPKLPECYRSSGAEEVDAEVTAKTAPTRDSCNVPEHLDYRVFTKFPCQGSTRCNMSGNTLVPTGELVTITCVPGYNLVQGFGSVVFKVFSECQYGVWDPKLPQCYKMCSPLISETLDLECQLGLSAVRCDKPMLPETTVLYTCKPFYKSSFTSQKNAITCKADGTWSMELPRCTPNCGISNLNPPVIQPAILGGNFSRPGNVPWQTAIYLREQDTWELRCGGTLISTRHVLTAAVCLTRRSLIYKPRVSDVANVMVAFGKNYRDWDSKEDTEVKAKIKEIIIHHYYYGETMNFVNDIGVMVLQSGITVNSYVMPACVDFGMKHLDQLRHDKTLQGYVAGWGNTEECTPQAQLCDSSSTTLKYVQTTILDLEECFNTTQHIKTFSQSRLTPDKFCSGNGSESVVQQGDSGGGLTFVFDGLHHIYGVVSVKLKMQLRDEFYYSFGAFSNVSYHLDWLNSILY